MSPLYWWHATILLQANTLRVQSYKQRHPILPDRIPHCTHKFMELLKSFYTAERRTACKQNWQIFFRDFGNLTPTVNSRLVTPPRRRKWFLLGKHKQFVSIELETRLEKSLSGRHKTPITGRAVDREKLNKKYCGTQFQSGKAAR